MKAIQRFWHQYSPLIHVGVWVFFSGMAWAGISTHGTRIEKLETRTESVSGDLREIKESLNWVKDALRGRRNQ